MPASKKSLPASTKYDGAKVIGTFAPDGSINVRMKSQDAHSGCEWEIEISK